MYIWDIIGTSVSRMENRSRYQVQHIASCKGHRSCVDISSGSGRQFCDNADWVTHVLAVYDHKKRLIKCLQWRSARDNEWHITNSGAYLHKRWNYSNGTGNLGSNMGWQLDHEDLYNQQDRQEEERRRQAEEQRRREEERRRREEERRRREEEERRRKENVDRQRTTEIAEQRYQEDQEESRAINVEIGLQMEQRMMEQSLKQTRSIGWSTADKVDIKGEMGEIDIRAEEDLSRERLEDEKRFREFVSSFHAIDKQEDKHQATLNVLKKLKPTDFERFPDKILLSVYRRLLEIPREILFSTDDGDNPIVDILRGLVIELGVTTGGCRNPKPCKMETSISRMINRSRYLVRHDADYGGHRVCVDISSGTGHHFCDHGNWVTHTLSVFDHRNRLTKSLGWGSCRDNEWHITNGGCHLHKQWEHSTGTGNLGTNMGWQVDLENHYNQQDRKEEERRRLEQERRRQEKERRRRELAKDDSSGTVSPIEGILQRLSNEQRLATSTEEPVSKKVEEEGAGGDVEGTIKEQDPEKGEEDVLFLEFVTELFQKLPPLPSTEAPEAIIIATVAQALKAVSAEMASFPLDTFTIYMDRLYLFKNIPVELFQTIAEIIEARPLLITPKLVDWVLSAEGTVNPKLALIVLEKSGVKTEKTLKYLETFPSRLTEEQCINYLCNYADGGFVFNATLLQKYLQLLKDKKNGKLLQHLLLLVDSIITGQYKEWTGQQKQLLEGTVSTVLSWATNEDKPLVLKFAGDWYLKDKISFMDHIYNGMMNLLNQHDGAYIEPVSEFFEDVADKDVKVLGKIVINAPHLQMNRKKELLLKTKLAILDARVRAGIRVPGSVIDAILGSFKPPKGLTSPANLAYDHESTYRCLRILLKLIPTRTDFPGELLLPYLDHSEADIRILAFSVLTAMIESGHVDQEGIKKFIKFGKNSFQNWDSVENHQESSRFMKLAINSMATDDGEEWENFSKDIASFCLPSVSSGDPKIVRGSLRTFETWLDKAAAQGLFEEEYLQTIFDDIHPRLMQRMLVHLLQLKGLSSPLHHTCIAKLAEMCQVGKLERFDEQELNDMSIFLTDAETERELKEELVMTVLAPQLEKCLPILTVIEFVVEFGNPQVVKVYGEAVTKLSVTHKLQKDTMNKLFDILKDPRFKISDRKAIAKCLFFILRLDKELLGNSGKLQQSLLQVLGDVNLRVFGLFSLCHATALPESLKDGILGTLQNICTRFLKMKDVALNEISQEEELNFKLSTFLLGRFGTLEQPDDDLQFNWMTEWTTLNKDDNLSYILSDQSKHARWLLKQEDPALVHQGQMLSLELGISKADILLQSGMVSEAESVADKTLKLGESPKLVLLKADIFMAKSSFKGALKFYKKAGSSNAAISFKMSKAYMALGKYDKAVEFISQSNASEREICKKSHELNDMLLSQTKSTSISKCQLKSFHAKASRTLSTREMLQMLDFMIGLKEYFDLSVIPGVTSGNWKVEFVIREIFSRLRNKTEKSWNNFYYEFLEVQKLYRNSELLPCVTKILDLQRQEQLEVNLGVVQEMLFLIKSLHIYEDPISVQNCMEMSDTLYGALRELRYLWIKQKFSPNVPKIPEMEEFFITYESSRKTYSQQLSLPFIGVFLDLTKSSNTLPEITEYLNFCQRENISFPEIQEFVGDLRLNNRDGLQGSTRNIVDDATFFINLKEYQIEYLKERLIKEVFEILTKSGQRNDEEMGMVVGELIGHFEDKIVTAEEVKDFVQFLTALDSRARTEAFQTFSTALSIDKSYKNVDLRPKVIKLAKKSLGGSKGWKKDIRETCMGELLHSAGEEKDVEALVREYIADNGGQFSSVFAKLTGFVGMVNRAILHESVVGVHPSRAIGSWNGEQITSWAATIRNIFKERPGASSDDEVECFAVIQQAIKMVKGYQLRQVGVMSLYILLSSKEKGCLAKIATGEGKSGLVAALAVYKCLQGHNVDVITNSSVLAQRDCSEWVGFFKLFGLTAEENSGLQDVPNQPKRCYLCDIVYGDTSAFQGDVLRHEFSLLGTRGSRQFDTVIVDEVDSMFIDGSNHSTRLIDKMPQMDYIEPLFAAIWQLVGAISATLVNVEGLTYATNKDICGATSDFIGFLVKSVQVQKLTLDKPCPNSGTLRQALDLFGREMQKEELTDSKFRRQVVNLLRQQNIWRGFPRPVREQLKGIDLKELNTGHALVDLYIKEKWNVGDMANLRNVLEVYLKVNILVYENIDNSMQLSPLFHSDPDGIELNNKYPALRFFKGLDDGKGDLFLLNYVENDTLYISRAVEHSVRKMFVSTYRSTEYSRANIVARNVIKAALENSRATQRAALSVLVPSYMSGILPKFGEETPVAMYEDPKMSFPGHIYELFRTKLDEWINSAIQAMFAMEVNRNYVIRRGSGLHGECDTITAVDFQNTGVTQESSVWGDGLHQFLQMKHKLKISPEYLATNFISNMSFFRRYNSNIYGLTGTLGDSNEVDLLKQLYRVETVNVPTFKEKRMLELGAVVAYDEAQWRNEILNSTAWEIGAGRVVLIICRTIEDVNNIRKYLGAKLKQACELEQDIDFRLYYRSDDASSEDSIAGKMRNGTVVIATNLAGRGTNIKLTDEVIQSGGLHVIITFLPTNVRVEEQAAGRAARNGEPGTSQIILNLEHDSSFIPLDKEPNIVTMKEERAHTEKERVDKIRDKLASELEIEEKQFAKFCKVKQFIQQGRPVSKTKPDFIMKGVGERWAVQLEVAKTRNDVVNWDKVDNDFDYFFENLKNEYKSETVIHNPSYYVLQGNQHLLSERDERQKAIDLYTRAINRDTVFVQHAFYNRAFGIINGRKEDYKNEAKTDLMEAAEVINNQILPSLTAMHSMVDGKELKKASPKEPKKEGEEEAFTTFKAAKEDNDFTKQMVQKINFNYLQVKSINEAIGVIEKSTRGVTAKFGDLKDFYDKNDTEIDYADIEEMEGNGFVRFMYVEEDPVPWWEILAVFLLGALQMIAGACLCLIGAVNIGAGLVAEGVSDVVTGITACVEGKFSWTDYLKNKAMSIGVSLLFAGAGVALKAVAALPKVASIIKTVTTAAKNVGSKVVQFSKNAGNFIKNSWMGSKVFTGAQGACSGIRKGATALRAGGSSGTRSGWVAVKTGANNFYKTVANTAPVQYVTTSRPWIYAKNQLTKAYNAVKDGVKWVWNKGQDARTKIFGYKNLNPATHSNLKTAGLIMGREVLSAGLGLGLEHGVYEQIGNAIQTSIKADVEEQLKHILHQDTYQGKKCRKLLASCKGKQFDVKIANEMRKALEGPKSDFGQKVYRTIVPALAKKIVGLIKLDKGKNPNIWVKVGAQLAAHLKSVVAKSLAIGETSKELAEAMPLAAQELDQILNGLQESIDKHDHATECKGTNKCVDPRDVERAISAYSTAWSEKLAGRMTKLIMGQVVKPYIQLSYDAAYNKFTKSKDFEEFLGSRAKVNATGIVGRRPGLRKYFKFFQLPVEGGNAFATDKLQQPVGDTDKHPSPVSDSEFMEPNKSAKTNSPSGDKHKSIPKRVKPARRSKPSLPGGDFDTPIPEPEDIFRFSSKHLDAAIDLYIKTEGGLRYRETIGGSLNKDGVPLRIVSRTSENGTQSFSRLGTGNSPNELQLMEFPVAKSGDEKSSLYSALTCDSHVSESRKEFESKLISFNESLKPRSLRSFKTI